MKASYLTLDCTNNQGSTVYILNNIIKLRRDRTKIRGGGNVVQPSGTKCNIYQKPLHFGCCNLKYVT